MNLRTYSDPEVSSSRVSILNIHTLEDTLPRKADMTNSFYTFIFKKSEFVTFNLNKAFLTSPHLGTNLWRFWLAVSSKIFASAEMYLRPLLFWEIWWRRMLLDYLSFWIIYRSHIQESSIPGRMPGTEDALLHRGWCGQRLVHRESKGISRVVGAWLFHQDLAKSVDAREKAEKAENTETKEEGERLGHEEKLVH